MKPSLLALLLLISCAPLGAQTPPPTPSRGEMLYSLHCIACHSKEIHWRDKGVVTGWRSLVAEVDRWQANARLGWETADVVATARYLNTLHYRFADPEKP